MRNFREFKGEKVNNFRRSKMLKVMYYGLTVQSRKGALKVTKWASDLPIVFNCSVIEFFTIFYK